jgi:hypothetical protein
VEEFLRSREQPSGPRATYIDRIRPANQTTNKGLRIQTQYLGDHYTHGSSDELVGCCITFRFNTLYSVCEIHSKLENCRFLQYLKYSYDDKYIRLASGNLNGVIGSDHGSFYEVDPGPQSISWNVRSRYSGYKLSRTIQFRSVNCNNFRERLQSQAFVLH